MKKLIIFATGVILSMNIVIAEDSVNSEVVNDTTKSETVKNVNGTSNLDSRIAILNEEKACIKQAKDIPQRRKCKREARRKTIKLHRENKIKRRAKLVETKDN